MISIKIEKNNEIETSGHGHNEICCRVSTTLYCFSKMFGDSIEAKASAGFTNIKPVKKFSKAQENIMNELVETLEKWKELYPGTCQIDDKRGKESDVNV